MNIGEVIVLICCFLLPVLVWFGSQPDKKRIQRMEDEIYHSIFEDDSWL